MTDELLKISFEVLSELSGYYYKRGVPHQSELEHCRCRECTDKRVTDILRRLKKEQNK